MIQLGLLVRFGAEMQADVDTTRWLVFDHAEIDLPGHRLYVDGVEIALERKAFAVLVLLAREPGRVFSRDEILDAVWEHRHVTPGVLNRVITLLRHALGESAEEHRYLQTVHGVGYRFDADVRFLRERETPDASSDEEITQVEAPAPVKVEAAPDTLETLPSAIRAAARKRLIWPGAVLLVIVLAVAELWIHRPGNQAGVPVARTPTLVVLPLRAVGSDADEKALAQGLSEDLITRLARVDGLQLISSTSAALAEAQNFDLGQLAARMHVTHALEGSLRQSGQRLRIDLRLIQVPRGRTLWAQNYDRNLSDVLTIQSDIAQSVASALTLKLGLVNGTVAGDPKLFLEYLKLRHIWLQGYQPGKPHNLVALLRAFVARAPDYAPAHGLRALALTFLFPPQVAASEIREAGPEARRALELDPGQIDALLASAVLACRAADLERCMHHFRHANKLAPADSLIRASYAYSLAAIGYLHKALEQTGIGVASDPLSYPANVVRARILDTLGRHKQALEALEASKSLAVATPLRQAYMRWYNAIWRHDFAAARQAVKNMLSADHYRDSYAAATDALIDPRLWPKTMPLIDASEQATGRYNVLRLNAPNPDIPAAIAGIEAMLHSGRSTYILVMWMPEYAALRRDPAFQDFLQRTHIIDYWNAHGWPPQCHPADGKAVCA